MKLTFLGADHQVTGSMHYLETDEIRLIVDCGMEQGGIHYESEELPVEYSELDYILLTHAHIDHSGMLPRAVKRGFRGTILATDASWDLDSIMLLDSAHIQEQDAEQENRKGKRAGKASVEPEYTVEDAKETLKYFRTVEYGAVTELSDSVRVRFIDAGHLLGSASIEVWVREGERETKLVFSGDIGNTGKPLIRDPQYISEADYVIMESTYGDRHHEIGRDHLSDMSGILQETFDRGGNAVFPAFAVGRTQELLYFIREIKDRGLVKGHDGFPVYVDSPLAVEATGIFKDNIKDCFDEATRKLVEQGINPIDFPGLKLSLTVDDSKAIQDDPAPKVIIAAAGMCNAGRIRHHLKHNLWREECSVVFAGYQAEGTLGRRLQDGADKVKILGEEIAVRSHIYTMADMSSHADQDGLIKWVKAYGESLTGRVFLVHGDDDAMNTLSALIHEETGYTVECPYSGSIFDLTKGEWEYEAGPKYISSKAASDSAARMIDEALTALSAYAQSVKEGANADKLRLAERIQAFIDELRQEG